MGTLREILADWCGEENPSMDCINGARIALESLPCRCIAGRDRCTGEGCPCRTPCDRCQRLADLEQGR